MAIIKANFSLKVISLDMKEDVLSQVTLMLSIVMLSVLMPLFSLEREHQDICHASKTYMIETLRIGLLLAAHYQQ